MPEGDSYTRAADRLRPALVGRVVEEVDGVPVVRRRSLRIVGRTVEGIRTHGKHLVVDLEGGWSIHTWLGMPGRWRVWRRGRPIPDERGALRLLLATADHAAGCFAAPTVEVERRQVIDSRLARLGPDVLADEFDADEYVRRAALVPLDRIVADVLLDQRVLAGVGNEYKCEVLFLEGIHPSRTWGSLDRDAREALAARARRLMLPNAHRGGDRITTAHPVPGREAWVYGRGGRPCRRCRTPISEGWVGETSPRITYWCPRCQPTPA